MSNDEYIDVDVIIRARTGKGVLLSPQADPQHKDWISRKRIHRDDAGSIDVCKLDDEISVRIAEFAARKAGLI